MTKQHYGTWLSDIKRLTLQELESKYEDIEISADGSVYDFYEDTTFTSLVSWAEWMQKQEQEFYSSSSFLKINKHMRYDDE